MRKTLIVLALLVLSVLAAGCAETQYRDTDTEETIFCAEYYDPVCGVDGVTYSNDCFAAVAGVEIAYEGECESEESEVIYCTEEQKQAEMCTMEYDPVCGSDGVTHGNACVACSTGVDYYTPGEC